MVADAIGSRGGRRIPIAMVCASLEKPVGDGASRLPLRPAETALRGVPSGTVGNEMFLSVCGLMSTGTRTLLISRWRTGGQSSYELIRQFIQELPYASAADAWQRSVQVTMETPLDFNREPRIKKSTSGEGMTAGHPFFWSGYMLVDTGWAPPKTEKPVAGPPVINLNAKAGALGAAPSAKD